ncbi:M20 family metallo-hydrolase [Mesobacterium pallidum]|uniref:M20 family metallo-hydrolase n=1 Tax=Mesobacterium pallidum TaxID=2872037 RepID=UPI001EE28666|nr:M20 family metallo-hydrolase [Mesobacterium pallidum]
MTDPTTLGQEAAHWLKRLEACSEDGPGVTRLPFTPQHRAALDVLRDLYASAGLETHLDAAGTLVGRRGDGPALLMGSHQDSVRSGGAYDGIMGVVLPALAVKHAKDLPIAVEVLAFADEEGVRFPTALVGSRALSGRVPPDALAMQDSSGISMAAAMEGFGLAPAKVPSLARDPTTVLGYLETHIEQGPVLETAGEALGVVTAICGIERHSVTFTGQAGHAGTLPMEGRRDALTGAAALVTEVERLARNTPGLRGTVGELHVFPNAVNAVPGAVRLTVELRSADDAQRTAAGHELTTFAHEIARARGLTLDMARSYAQPAAPCDQGMRGALQAAVRRAGGKGLELPSGATHDASAVADLCPMAMLFVRCRDGVSHVPEEYSSPEDMGLAIATISDFISNLK